MKTSAARQLKSEIIVNLLDFLEYNDNEKKKEAIEKLHEFAKFYKIPLRRKAIASDNKKYLKKFILNLEGYIETIPNLYNSLI